MLRKCCSTSSVYTVVIRFAPGRGGWQRAASGAESRPGVAAVAATVQPSYVKGLAHDLPCHETNVLPVGQATRVSTERVRGFGSLFIFGPERVHEPQQLRPVGA